MLYRPPPAERIRESFAAYGAARAAGTDIWRLEFLYWGDGHFLISATYHMNKALDRLSSGTELPKRLRNQIRLMRHLLEHWNEEEDRRALEGAGQDARRGCLAMGCGW